eukprot:284816642_3
MLIETSEFYEVKFFHSDCLLSKIKATAENLRDSKPETLLCSQSARASSLGRRFVICTTQGVESPAEGPLRNLSHLRMGFDITVQISRINMFLERCLQLFLRKKTSDTNSVHLLLPNRACCSPINLSRDQPKTPKITCQIEQRQRRAIVATLLRTYWNTQMPYLNERLGIPRQTFHARLREDKKAGGFGRSVVKATGSQLADCQKTAYSNRICSNLLPHVVLDGAGDGATSTARYAAGDVLKLTKLFDSRPDLIKRDLGQRQNCEDDKRARSLMSGCLTWLTSTESSPHYA